MLMTQAGWKWFCTNCAFEYYGEEAPEECPNCGNWDSFSQVEDDG